MANSIFDWDDDEEEKRSDAEVWSAYPLAQPPETSLPSPPDQPAETPASPYPNDVWPSLSGPNAPLEQPSSWNQPAASRPEREPVPWQDDQNDTRDQSASQPGVWSEYSPDSPEETARKGGMAWSAGIVFFSSIAFMLFLGWIADWLLGTSPWGVVAGIVLGSILGFVQFFRISSRIFAPKAQTAERPLMPRDDEHV